MTSCTVTTGNATATTGCATEAVEEAVPFGPADSVTRGGTGAGCALSTLEVAAGAAPDSTALRGRFGRTRGSLRLGSGEVCGSLCSEPETVSALPWISTTDG